MSSVRYAMMLAESSKTHKQDVTFARVLWGHLVKKKWKVSLVMSAVTTEKAKRCTTC